MQTLKDEPKKSTAKDEKTNVPQVDQLFVTQTSRHPITGNLETGEEKPVKE